MLTCKPENSFFFGTRELGCRKSAHIAKYVTLVPALFDGTSTRPLHFCPGLYTQFVVDTQAHTLAVVCLCSVIFSVFLGKKAFLFLFLKKQK